MHIDYFSGTAVDLKRGSREPYDVLAVLARDNRVSTWDMSENPWLVSSIEYLTREGLIVELDEPYPWHRYQITDAGLARLDELKRECNGNL